MDSIVENTRMDQRQQQNRDTSISALKAVYFVVIGLAITEAAKQCFTDANGKLDIPEETRPTIYLFLILAPTICRFVQGSTLHFDHRSGSFVESMLNYLGFMIQASAFFAMALSIGSPTPENFFAAFFILLLADSAWIAVLTIVRKTRLSDVQKQWLKSDCVLSVIIVAGYIALRNWPSECVSWINVSIALFVASAVATILDYKSNRDYYIPPQSRPRRVVIESPYAGNDGEELERNEHYLREALRHSLLKGEAPFASHAIYTLPGVLRDQDSTERMIGIGAGFLWHEKADMLVVYKDHGISPGMIEGIANAKSLGIPIEYRMIKKNKKQEEKAES